MSLLIHDGFDQTDWSNTSGGSAAYLARIDNWSGVGNPNSGQTPRSVAGRTAGHAIDNKTFAFQRPTLTLAATYTGLVVGQAIKFDSNTPILTLLKAGNEQLTLMLLSSGAIEIRTGGTGGTLQATSATGAVPASGWCYLELKAGATAAEVRVNGTAVASATGFTLPNGSGYSQYEMGYLSFIDDLYILTTDDSTLPNDYLGDVTSRGVPPSADSSVTWSPSSGSSNYAMLATTPPVDDDSTYVQTSTASAVELYTQAPGVSGTVYATTYRIMGRRESGGAGQLTAVVKLGSTVYAGTPKTVRSDDWDGVTMLSTTSPATGTAWGTSEIDGGGWGFRTEAGLAAPMRVTMSVLDVLYAVGPPPPPPPLTYYTVAGQGDMIYAPVVILDYQFGALGDLLEVPSAVLSYAFGGKFDSWSTGGVSTDPAYNPEYTFGGLGDLVTVGDLATLTAYTLGGVGDLVTVTANVSSYSFGGDGQLLAKLLLNGQINLLSQDVYRR